MADKETAQQSAKVSSGTARPVVSVDMATRMMVMNSSIVDLFCMLKMSEINPGPNLVNPAIKMMLTDGVLKSIEATGSTEIAEKFKSAAMMTTLTSAGKGGSKMDPTMMMLMMGGKGGDMSSMLPMLMMNQGKDGSKPMDPTMMMMLMSQGKGGDMSSMLPMLMMNQG
ncbi:MAG: hypothetical protein ACRC5M_06915, partial [Anaeroplasmataceae bacterium]